MQTFDWKVPGSPPSIPQFGPDYLHEFLSSNGRLNRFPYFVRVSILYALQKVLLMLFPLRNLALESASSSIEFIGRLSGLILADVIAIAAIVFMILQVIKRLHDMNHSGWYALLGAVPIFNIALGLFLTLMKGTVGPNRFGDDPLKYGGRLF
jgi:uncharacterized membrane protein YhaH (DUF805 family)